MVAADEGKSPDVVDGLGGGVEDGSTEKLVEREALVMGVVLLTAEPRVVSKVAGPERKENSRVEVEQHSELVKP